MTVSGTVLLLFAVSTSALGQVMLKHGMQIASVRAADSRGSMAVTAATTPWVLLGLAVFGISALAWMTTLARVPLSVAYPFNALGYLGVLVASVVFLHERASSLTWAGSLFVVMGLVMVVLAQPPAKSPVAKRHGSGSAHASLPDLPRLSGTVRNYGSPDQTSAQR